MKTFPRFHDLVLAAVTGACLLQPLIQRAYERMLDISPPEIIRRGDQPGEYHFVPVSPLTGRPLPGGQPGP